MTDGIRPRRVRSPRREPAPRTAVLALRALARGRGRRPARSGRGRPLASRGRRTVALALDARRPRSPSTMRTDRLVFVAAAGPAAGEVIGLSIDAAAGIGGYAFTTGQPIAIADVAADPRFDRTVAEATGYLPGTLLAVPLADERGIVGVLEVLDRRGRQLHVARPGRRGGVRPPGHLAVRRRAPGPRRVDDPRRLAPGARSAGRSTDPVLDDDAIDDLVGDAVRSAAGETDDSRLGLVRSSRAAAGRRPGPRRARDRVARCAAASVRAVGARRPSRRAASVERLAPRPGASRSPSIRGSGSSATVPSAAWTDRRSSRAAMGRACGSRSSIPGWTARIPRSAGGSSARGAWSPTRTARRRSWRTPTAATWSAMGPPAPGSSTAWRRRPRSSRSGSWGRDNRGKGQAVEAAVDWAIEAGIEVVNLSLSSRSEAMFGTFHDLADRAYFAQHPAGLCGQQRPGALLSVAVRGGRLGRGP